MDNCPCMDEPEFQDKAREGLEKIISILLDVGHPFTAHQRISLLTSVHAWLYGALEQECKREDLSPDEVLAVVKDAYKSAPKGAQDFTMTIKRQRKKQAGRPAVFHPQLGAIGLVFPDDDDKPKDN